MTFAPAYPHDDIEEIGPDLFLVRGSVKMNALMTITRNMVIVRHQGELTLVDPIRLEPEQEEQLRKLGEPKRILRLGPMHGLDDAYYRETFGLELWAPGTSETYPEPAPDVVVTNATSLPFPDARVIPISGAKQAESVLLVERDGGLLVTCDAIQHYGDYRHNNFVARLLMPFIGFPKTTIIGPIWIKMMTPPESSLEDSFRALLAYEFDRLVCGHGSLLTSGAKASVKAAIDKAYA